MRRPLAGLMALMVTVALTMGCCIAPVVLDMAIETPMHGDMDHGTAPHSKHGEDSPDRCCSIAQDASAILTEARFALGLDDLTPASLPILEFPRSPVQADRLWSDIHQRPPGRHWFLHDISILRI